MEHRELGSFPCATQTLRGFLQGAVQHLYRLRGIELIEPLVYCRLAAVTDKEHKGR